MFDSISGIFGLIGGLSEMRRKTYLLVILLLAATVLYAAGAKEDPSVVLSAARSATKVDIAALKGPTAMGMVKLMADSDAGICGDGNEYSFMLEGAVDAVTPKLVKGDVDISAIPANLASVLYNNTNGQIQVLAINTLGVLYIAEKGDTVKSVSDLRGRTIYASGKGATPEYALMYILAQNGLEVGKDVFIEWRSEHAECVAALLASDDAVAMLPQPFLTTALLTNPDVRIALDLNSLWYDKMGSVLITGVVAARKDFVQENEDAVRAFLSSYGKSVDFVNSNPEEAAKLIGDYGIIAEKVALKALPGCNITFISGEEMQEALSNYLGVLYEQNPASVGGKVPEDGFYFK